MSIQFPSYNEVKPSNPKNPVVFLDITIAGVKQGRIVIELFADICPKTCENFRQFCTGEYRKSKEQGAMPIGYKGTLFHRVIDGFMIQGGDFVSNDGKGSQSIHGTYFDDENFSVSHDSPGIVAMANTGPNTNGCQFFITCEVCKYLDGKYVAFGKVIDGMMVVRKIEKVSVGKNNKPKFAVAVAECGEL